MPITRISRGRYTFRIEDRSSVDNFQLAGLDWRSTKAFVGTVTWTVRLKRGIYTFRSDAHPLTMKGRFRVV